MKDTDKQQTEYRLILQCTKKLQDALKIKAEALPPETKPMMCWHGNIFMLGRRKCLLITHNESLYSIYFYGVTQKELGKLHDYIQIRLKHEMTQDGFNDTEIKKMLSNTQTLDFAKSSDRSVLGSMNDMIHSIKIIADYHETTDEDFLTHHINKTPYKKGDYCYPKNILKNKIHETSHVTGHQK